MNNRSKWQLDEVERARSEWQRAPSAGTRDLTHKPNKYHFEELEIGESKTYICEEVNEHALRQAATNWGTRYGFWLSVVKADDGYMVTRLEGPPTRKKVRNLLLQERMKRMEDGIRFLSVMVVQVKGMIEEIQDKL